MRPSIAAVPASSSWKDTPCWGGRRSDRQSGRIRRVVMRPAPECVWVVDADPVSRKRPPVGSWSTRRRTASNTPGTRCHSSISNGVGSRPMIAGSASTISRSDATSSRRTDRHRCVAVAVLPTPFGPSSKSAGNCANNTSISSSITRRTYEPRKSTPLATTVTLPLEHHERYHWCITDDPISAGTAMPRLVLVAQPPERVTRRSRKSAFGRADRVPAWRSSKSPGLRRVVTCRNSRFVATPFCSNE